MLTPVNYVDLFDRLYPEQHLAGLTDDGQITAEELNRRYATVRANQRTMMLALNSIYSAQPDGSHFRDYMLPYWEVAVSKKFDLGPTKIVSLRYRVGFDPGGELLTFPENRTGLHLHDLGSDLINSMIEVCVYVDGVLIAPSRYHIHVAQGGFSVYIVEEEVNADAQVAHVVLLRKFNQAGLTRGAAVRHICAATTVSPFDIVVPSLTELGHVYDIRYYKLFHKIPGDRWFRPVTENLVGKRVGAVGDSAIFTKMDGAVKDEEFVVVCTAEFWKYEHDGPITENTNAALIDLVDQYGLPAPVSCIEDVDVYVEGRLMRPNVDYWLQWGDPVNSYRTPPRIVLRGDPTDIHGHILVRTNAPYDPVLCPEIREDTISDPEAIYRMPPTARPLRLLEDVGLTFSGGYLVNVADNQNVISDNLGLHIGGLPDTRFMYFRSRFVLTSGAMEGAIRESGHQTALEKFAILVGVKADGTAANGNPLLSADFVEAYRVNTGATTVSSASPKNWAETYFNALYFWVRDAQTDARSAGEPLDARDNAVVPLARLLPWQQDDFALSFDCRSPISSDAGYVTNRSLDCRNV
jgi:hypothetical protein